MPKYYEDKEEDGQACSGVREDLRQCLLESPCVLQVSGPAPLQPRRRRRPPVRRARCLSGALSVHRAGHPCSSPS